MEGLKCWSPSDGDRVKKPSMAFARIFKEKRAEATAKLAASDLEEINREREYEERAKMEREESQ